MNMPKYAVLDSSDTIVINTIVCDTLELAQEITNATCIPFPTDRVSPAVGDTWDGTKFYPDFNL
jgi:hypothetical protein